MRQATEFDKVITLSIMPAKAKQVEDYWNPLWRRHKRELGAKYPSHTHYQTILLRSRQPWEMGYVAKLHANLWSQHWTWGSHNSHLAAHKIHALGITRPWNFRKKWLGVHTPLYRARRSSAVQIGASPWRLHYTVCLGHCPWTTSE